MRRPALAAAMLAAAGPACAADFPVAAPAYTAPAPPQPAVWDWSGVYIGANGGGAWAETTWGFPNSQFFSSTPPLPRSFSTSPSGAVAGGQIGIIRQVGPWLFGVPWVFGVEFTGDWANAKETLVGPLDPAFLNDVFTTKLSDLETLTFRFGVPVNNWLFYGKAGGATGTVDLHAVSGPPIAGVVFDHAERAWGTTVGAGIEYGLTRDLSIGAEYDFIRLHPGSFNGTASGGQPVLGGANAPFDVQIVLGRINYKFWTPPF